MQVVQRERNRSTAGSAIGSFVVDDGGKPRACQTDIVPLGGDPVSSRAAAKDERKLRRPARFVKNQKPRQDPDKPFARDAGSNEAGVSQ